MPLLSSLSFIIHSSRESQTATRKRLSTVDGPTKVLMVRTMRHDACLEASRHDQLPSPEEIKMSMSKWTNEKSSATKRTTRKVFVAVLVIATILIGGALCISTSLRNSHAPSSQDDGVPKDNEEKGGNATNTPQTFEDRLRGMVSIHSGDVFLGNRTSYQILAFKRLKAQGRSYEMYSEKRLKQVYGLLTLYFATNDSGFGWQSAVFWERSYDECTWEGITCDSSNQVVAIDLDNFGLDGVLPVELSLMESVERIRLDNNPGLTGDIPAFLGRMNLVELSLKGCGYIGDMPEVICEMKIKKSLVILEVDCLSKIACDSFCCEACA